MPCGIASRRVIALSSRVRRPSLLISSRPRSRGNRRITALSPCCVGMVATRTSSSLHPMRARAVPSCGRRRSAMLRLARISMREISACGDARNKLSTRTRTVSPERNGSTWISLARRSNARSNRSLSARTTGAPPARSRKLSISSSDRCAPLLPIRSTFASSASARLSRTIVVSSYDAITTLTIVPNTISAAPIAAVSDGSATARRRAPSAALKGKIVDSRRKRREQSSRRGMVASNCGRPKYSDTSSAKSAAERSVASQNSRKGRMSVVVPDFSIRACACGGSEYFSRRCCRKRSAGRTCIAFTALTLLLECNSFGVSRRSFILDLFLSKNVIVAQITARPDQGGSDAMSSHFQRWQAYCV